MPRRAPSGIPEPPSPRAGAASQEPRLLTLPTTETPSELTRELDLADGETAARLLAACDAQIFAGWRGSRGLRADAVLDACARLAQAAVEVLRTPGSGRILLAGAGTSGRLAHLACRQFNRLLRRAGRPEAFQALVAGGSKALVRSVEGAEDDHAAAVRQLEVALPPFGEPVLYLGISCGLSAPAVASQLHALRGREGAVRALLGFNRAEEARSTPIEEWDETFASVLEACLADPAFILANPIVGPEALTGSSRLKGGTATKIILESVFATALESLGLIAPGGCAEATASEDEDVDLDDPLRERIRRHFDAYADAIDAAHRADSAMGQLGEMAAAALKRAGSVYYLGRETAGIMGLIDASECPPTFGSQYSDVRAYLRSGWAELMDKEEAPTITGDEFQIAHQDFQAARLPDLERGDLVVGIAIDCMGPNTAELLALAREKRATTAAVLVRSGRGGDPNIPENVDQVLLVDLPCLGLVDDFPNYAETALKLFLNAASTAAFLQMGKVFHNQMIDLRIANQKLVLRAVETLRDLAGVDEEEAWRALVKVVHNTDNPTAEQLESTPTALVREASGRARIVPTALLAAALRQPLEEVGKLLAQDPVVRRVLGGALEGREE